MWAYMRPLVLMVALNTMAASATDKCPHGLYKEYKEPKKDDCYDRPYCCEEHLKCFKKNAHEAYCLEECNNYDVYGDKHDWSCKKHEKPYVPPTPVPAPTKKECPYRINEHQSCYHSPECCAEHPHPLKCFTKNPHEAFCRKECDKYDVYGGAHGWECKDMYPSQYHY